MHSHTLTAQPCAGYWFPRGLQFEGIGGTWAEEEHRDSLVQVILEVFGYGA